MSRWRSRPRQTLSQERSLSESPLASFRCSYWATVPCKNQTAFSLRKEPLWRKSIRPSAPRLRRHWQNSNTVSNPHVYREFQKSENDSERGHHDPSHCYTTKQRASKCHSSFSERECSRDGTCRIAQARQCGQLA